MTMTADKFIKQCQDWVGKNKADGSHKEIIDIYNSQSVLPRGYKMKYSSAWCAAFVSAVSIKLGYTKIIPAECSCGEMIKLFQNLGVWQESDSYTPNVADIIFYDWNDDGKGDAKGWPDHVGVVESVSNGVITVIEGNISNKVGRRTIRVNGQYIRGYACPKYEVASEYYPKFTNKSIVDGLKSIKVDSSFGNRKKIAKANGIIVYVGTSTQNTKLLNLAKQGKLKKPAN